MHICICICICVYIYMVRSTLLSVPVGRQIAWGPILLLGARTPFVLCHLVTKFIK